MHIKKILITILILAVILTAFTCFVACEKETKEQLKVGLVCLNDVSTAYDNNFINALQTVCTSLGVEYIVKTNVAPNDNFYLAVKDLIDKGCDVIFANSYQHESQIIKCAKDFPNIEFCHATGVMARVENLRNYHNAFASIYEGRYLTGITAGLKLNEMIREGVIEESQAKLGYVGAYPYAEVISGYTAFYLGAKSVCSSVTMDVVFTDSWFDVAQEGVCVRTLFDNGAKIISQHADSMGAPLACESLGVYNVSYNDSTIANCPNTFLISSKIDWAPYYQYAIGQKLNGNPIATDWCGGLKEGAVVLSNVNSAVVAEGTEEAINKAEEELKNGTLNVFNVNNFTVNGEKLHSYLVDLDGDSLHLGDTEVIAGGVFEESKYRSAPYFDLKIDGINILEN